MLGIIVALSAGRLYAHDFWIEPTNFRPAVGDEVALVLRVGQDLAGDRLPYITDWFSDYRVVSPGSARPVTGLMGDDPAGRFTVAESGVHVIGYRSTRDFVEMEPEKFRSYLREEGLDWVINRRAELGDGDRPAREYYSRCAKSLIDADGEEQGLAWGRDIGYTLELTPEANPYALESGDRLPMRLRYKGEPIEGILVQAFAANHPDDKISARTNAEGRVSIPMERPGLWLVKAVHIIETPEGVTGAEWESFWASLTFMLRDSPR